MLILDPRRLQLAVLLSPPRAVTDAAGAPVTGPGGLPLAYYDLLLLPVDGGPVQLSAKGPMPKGDLAAGPVTLDRLEARPYEVRRGGELQSSGVAYRVTAVTAAAAPTA